MRLTIAAPLARIATHTSTLLTSFWESGSGLIRFESRGRRLSLTLRLRILNPMSSTGKEMEGAEMIVGLGLLALAIVIRVDGFDLIGGD